MTRIKLNYIPGSESLMNRFQCKSSVS